MMVGIEGFEPSLLVPQTSMLKPLHYIPHNISERQDLNLQPLAPKASMLPFAPLPVISRKTEDMLLKPFQAHIA